MSDNQLVNPLADSAELKEFFQGYQKILEGYLGCIVIRNDKYMGKIVSIDTQEPLAGSFVVKHPKKVREIYISMFGFNSHMFGYGDGAWEIDKPMPTPPSRILGNTYVTKNGMEFACGGVSLCGNYVTQDESDYEDDESRGQDDGFHLYRLEELTLKAYAIREPKAFIGGSHIDCLVVKGEYHLIDSESIAFWIPAP
jgi:hypothetical protein